MGIFNWLARLNYLIDPSGPVKSTLEERMQAEQKRQTALSEISQYIRNTASGLRPEDHLESLRLLTNLNNANRVYDEMVVGYCTDRRRHLNHYAVVL